VKSAPLILVATAVLTWSAPASAQLITHPKCDTMHCREVSQKLNLKHAKYLCNHGRHVTKRWGCQAVRWLAKELRETRRTLRPRVVVRSLQASDLGAWMCIHRYEGAWDSNTGNGYYGGLQMDYGFMRSYGSDFMGRWGTADHWPPWAQLMAARRARDSGRGYGPWPNTARYCGLL
jgi:hypothetical protein